MNLIEAHKSGRRFKAPEWYGWVKLVDSEDGQGIAVEMEDGGVCKLYISDLLEDKYILEPEAKLLTREQIKGLLDYPTTYLHESGVAVINEKRFMAELDELFKETE